MDSKQQPHLPDKFLDGSQVLVISRGLGEREKQFVMWVELNFEDDKDFSQWMSTHDAQNEKLGQWLDHYFPNVPRRSRIMTLEEALRMSMATTDRYGEARTYLSNRDGPPNQPG